VYRIYSYPDVTRLAEGKTQPRTTSTSQPPPPPYPNVFPVWFQYALRARYHRRRQLSDCVETLLLFICYTHAEQWAGEPVRRRGSHSRVVCKTDDIREWFIMHTYIFFPPKIRERWNDDRNRKGERYIYIYIYM